MIREPKTQKDRNDSQNVIIPYTSEADETRQLYRPWVVALVILPLLFISHVLCLSGANKFYTWSGLPVITKEDLLVSISKFLVQWC